MSDNNMNMRMNMNMIQYRKYVAETDKDGVLELIAYLQDYELEIYGRMKPSKEYVDESYIQDLLESCDKHQGELVVAVADVAVEESSTDTSSPDQQKQDDEGDDKKKETTITSSSSSSPSTAAAMIAGYACVLTKVPSEEEHEIEYIYGDITDLAVHPNHQRKGIAKKLLQICEEKVKAAGTKYLRTEVLAKNQAAVQAYQRFGFQSHLLTLEKEL